MKVEHQFKLAFSLVDISRPEVIFLMVSIVQANINKYNLKGMDWLVV